MDDTTLRTLGDAAAAICGICKPAARGGQSLDRRAGQADGRAVCRHRRGRDACRGRGPVPPLQAQAAHARDDRQGKGPRAAGGGYLSRSTLRMDPPEVLAAGRISTRTRASRRSKTRWRARPTSSPRASPTTRRSRKSLRALMHRRGAALSAERQSRRTRRLPSTGCIMSSPSPLPNCRAIRFWRSTAAKKRAF